MNAARSLVLSLSLLGVACDADPGDLDGQCEDGATPAGGKADDAEGGAGASFDEDVVVLSRRSESGADDVVVLEGIDALAFEELTLDPDLTEGDIDAFLEVTVGGSDASEAAVDDAPRFRSMGFCVPLVNRHVRQMHVGWTDENLILRAPATPTHQAGSWNTETAAFSAIKAVLDQTCQEILAWQATAPVQAHIRQAAYTGVRGRVCFWNAECTDAFAAELIYKKTAAVGGWHAGKISTAYPVPF